MNAVLFLDRLLRGLDQAAHVGGRCTAEVHHDVRVDMRNLRVALPKAFHSALIHETTSANAFDLLEDRSRARVPIQPWMLSPAPAEILLHDAVQRCLVAAGEAEGDCEDDVSPVMEDAVVVAKAHIA